MLMILRYAHVGDVPDFFRVLFRWDSMLFGVLFYRHEDGLG